MEDVTLQFLVLDFLDLNPSSTAVQFCMRFVSWSNYRSQNVCVCVYDMI